MIMRKGDHAETEEDEMLLHSCHKISKCYKFSYEKLKRYEVTTLTWKHL